MNRILGFTLSESDGLLIILVQLTCIIETNVHQRSAGYKARGKKVLAQIAKIRHK